MSAHDPVHVVVLAPGDRLFIYRQHAEAVTERFEFDELLAAHQRCRTQPLQDTGYCATVDSLRKVLVAKLDEIEQLKTSLAVARSGHT